MLSESHQCEIGQTFRYAKNSENIHPKGMLSLNRTVTNSKLLPIYIYVKLYILNLIYIVLITAFDTISSYRSNCSSCYKSIRENQNFLCCFSCKLQNHAKCIHFNLNDFHHASRSPSWICEQCISSVFPFIITSLNNFEFNRLSFILLSLFTRYFAILRNFIQIIDDS